MTDDRFLLADFTGRGNWPTLLSVWHPLKNETASYSEVSLSVVSWACDDCSNGGM